MKRQSDKVMTAALELPPRSLAKLAERLLASLDDPKHGENIRFLANESEDRIDAYEQGKMRAVPGADVFRATSVRRS